MFRTHHTDTNRPLQRLAAASILLLLAACVTTGTDPNNPLMTFRINTTLLPNRQIRLDWPSAPGHGYRLLNSTNFVSWLPASTWIRAIGANTSLTLPPATNSAPNFFRLEAQP